MCRQTLSAFSCAASAGVLRCYHGASDAATEFERGNGNCGREAHRSWLSIKRRRTRNTPLHFSCIATTVSPRDGSAALGDNLPRPRIHKGPPNSSKSSRCIPAVSRRPDRVENVPHGSSMTAGARFPRSRQGSSKSAAVDPGLPTTSGNPPEGMHPRSGDHAIRRPRTHAAQTRGNHAF
jgi:hypothetical protein